MPKKTILIYVKNGFGIMPIEFLEQNQTDL